jgi:hypothetical protein
MSSLDVRHALEICWWFSASVWWRGSTVGSHANGSQPVSRMTGADNPGETVAQFVYSLQSARRTVVPTGSRSKPVTAELVVKVAAGDAGRAIDRRQAEVFLEYLRRVRDHRLSEENGQAS